MLIYSGKYGTAAKPTFAMLSDCGWYVEVKGDVVNDILGVGGHGVIVDVGVDVVVVADVDARVLGARDARAVATAGLAVFAGVCVS